VTFVCGQTVEWIKTKLGKQVGLDPGHNVLDGDPAPPPQRDTAPQFPAHICCGQMAGWIKTLLGREIGLGPSDIVLDGDPAPPPQNGGTAPPTILAHVYCDQTAGWIKIALGWEVGLGPGHIVLDGDPAPPPKKWTQPSIFGPFLLWPNCGMHQDSTWYEGRPWPRQRCVRWGPSSPPPKKRHNRPHLFSAHVYCGHGRPSQLLLRSFQNSFTTISAVCVRRKVNKVTKDPYITS